MAEKRKQRTPRAKWTEEDLHAAAEKVKTGISIHKASQQFGIPYSTLQEKLKKNDLLKASPGLKPVFSKEQEAAFAERLKHLAKLFYGIHPSQICAAAYRFAELNKIDHPFNTETKVAGKDWFHGFMARNPTISIRKPENTSLNRISAFNRESVGIFYDNLEEVMTKYSFTAQTIWNMDETGVTCVVEAEKVVAEKGQKRVGTVASGERGKTVTVVCAMSAQGDFVPPMFIYPRMRMSPTLERGGPVGSIYHCSKNGWTNEELFLVWLQHFHKHVKSTRDEPVLLILDNHFSHSSMSAFDYCRKNGIVMVSLPPHTSHRLQPLDVTFFGPFKTAYKKECDSFMKINANQRITNHDIAPLVNQAYSSVASVQKGISGFECTGIWPFKRDIFTDADYAPAEFLLTGNVDRCEAIPCEKNLEDNQPKKKLPEKSHFEDSEANKAIRVVTLDIPVINEEDLNPEDTIFIVPSDDLNNNSPDEVPCAVPTQASAHQVHQLLQQSTANASPAAFLDDALPLPKSPALFNNSCDQPRCRGRKRKTSVILTSSPVKEELENAAKKKREREQKSASKVGARVQSGSKGKKPEKTGKRPPKDTSKTTGTDVDICAICLESGKSEEKWYRCRSCGEWAHAACTSADSPKYYMCDRCTN